MCATLDLHNIQVYLFSSSIVSDYPFGDRSVAAHVSATAVPSVAVQFIVQLARR